MRLYLSGPMTGYAGWNFKAFDRFAKRLRAIGHVVHNPAEWESRSYWLCLVRDLGVILSERLAGLLDGIAVHGRWGESRGARLEVALGILLGMKIHRVEDLLKRGRKS